jgi:hypothetical protein
MIYLRFWYHMVWGSTARLSTLRQIVVKAKIAVLVIAAVECNRRAVGSKFAASLHNDRQTSVKPCLDGIRCCIQDSPNQTDGWG